MQIDALADNGHSRVEYGRGAAPLELPVRVSAFSDGLFIMRATDINAMRRKIGMVFQSFNLYPHMTALGNVTLALRKVVGKSRDEADTLGLAALDRVGLAGFAEEIEPHRATADLHMPIAQRAKPEGMVLAGIFLVPDADQGRF